MLHAAVGSGGDGHQKEPRPGAQIEHPSVDRQIVPVAKVTGVIDGPEDEGAVRRLAGGFARKAAALIEAVPGRVGGLIEAGVGRLVDGLGRAVEGFLGGTNSPAGALPPVGAVAPPPAPAPVAPGCASGGPSVSGGPGSSCGGYADGLFHGFAVLVLISGVVPLPAGEALWLSREPLLPSAAPRPPNGRPG